MSTVGKTYGAQALRFAKGSGAAAGVYFRVSGSKVSGLPSASGSTKAGDAIIGTKDTILGVFAYSAATGLNLLDTSMFTIMDYGVVKCTPAVTTGQTLVLIWHDGNQND